MQGQVWIDRAQILHKWMNHQYKASKNLAGKIFIFKIKKLFFKLLKMNLLKRKL
jgi:hypothetical protein